LTIAVRQVTEELADLIETLAFTVGEEVGIAGYLRLHAGAAKFFHGNFLAEHGLHHFRAGDEHFGNLVDYENEVGQRRRIHGAAGARP